MICATVPKLAKLTVQAARAALVGNGCALGKVKQVYSAKVRRGLIVAQTVRAGKTFKRGTKIGVSVSRGPRR